jgi:pSer/pThr/pTyr-binding forkhead associated (FHA) protein
MLVRFRIECRGRVELHEIEKDEIDIGRSASCDLTIDHATIAPRHARVLVRRGRLILADLGKTKIGTTRGRHRVVAPVALGPSETFGLGDVKIAASLVDDSLRSFVGMRILEGALVAELETSDRAVRRYRVALTDGDTGELALIDEGEAETGLAWFERTRSSRSFSPHLPELLGLGRFDNRPYLVERVRKGIRLASLLDGIARDTVQPPIETLIATIALVARSVAAMNSAWGPHGAIDPRRVQLGLDGSVLLLRPGPHPSEVGTVADAYVAPERRICSQPTVPGDAFALGVLGKTILHRRSDCPTRIRAICYWLAHVDPARRPRDLEQVAGELQRAAQTAGLDPTFGHVARVARLLSPNLNRPLCTVSRAGADVEPPGGSCDPIPGREMLM